MAWKPGFGLTHHIRLTADNSIKKTLCGREYGDGRHLELAEIAKDGRFTNIWRELEDDEICKKCIKSYRHLTARPEREGEMR